MSTVSRGFRGRRERPSVDLPPGQYLVEDFPVLSAGPTPSIDLDDRIGMPSSGFCLPPQLFRQIPALLNGHQVCNPAPRLA